MDYMTTIRECRYAGKCGACQTLNLTYERELSMKMKKEITLLGKFGHVEEILSMDCPLRYRNKVQYLFRWDRGRVRYGLYRSSDGGLVTVDDCMMEDKNAAAVCHTVRRMIDKYKITVFDGRKGLLRHVMARRARSTGEIVCAIVTSPGAFPMAEDFADDLAKRCPGIRSVSRIINDTDTALWMNGEETVLYGNGYITDELCGCTFRISAKSFYQINPTATEMLYRKAVEFTNLRETDEILDAYCGIGTIGIIAAKEGCRSLTGFDVNADAVHDAEVNANLNGLTNARYLRGDDAAVVRELGERKWNVIFADPPRAGCDRKFLDFVGRCAPERFVYVSCNPETLARDLGYMMKKGYKTEKIQPVDMFPGTGHCETVILLSRKDVYERIKFDVNVEDLQGRASSTATYSEIKAYILEKYGLKVSSLYIAQIKDKCGFEKRDNYNIGEGKSKELICPPEKEEAIMDAFRHFGMLRD